MRIPILLVAVTLLWAGQARGDSGKIVAWGDNDYGQCDVPPPNANFIVISGGTFHTLGIKLNHTIMAWGINSEGECNVPEPNADFVAIAAAPAHT